MIPNQTEREKWNGDSGARWARDPDRHDRVLAAVGDALLDAADLASGQDILDVGCGCGATTLAAATQVGSGTAMGIDLSEPMLRAARDRAAEHGLTNATFVNADAQTHPFESESVDRVISRFGTMFFDDPVVAFANIRRSVRPGGRLCIATWRPLGENPWLTIPGAVLLSYGHLPQAGPPGAPGMFAQSVPDTVTAVLSAAGWQDITCRPVLVPLLLGSDPTAAAAHLADTGVGRAILETVPEAHHSEAIAAVEQTLEEYVDSDGVRLDGAILLTTATG